MENWILETNAAVVARFFAVIDTLKSERVLAGLQTYCTRYGIDRRNLMQIRKQPTRALFRIAYIIPLVRDYHINAHYLLTGEGEMWQQGFNAETIKKLQIIRKRTEAKK